VCVCKLEKNFYNQHELQKTLYPQTKSIEKRITPKKVNHKTGYHKKIKPQKWGGKERKLKIHFLKIRKINIKYKQHKKKEKSRGMEMNVLSLNAMEQAPTPKVMSVCC
jgi:hypothetical protein